MRFGYIRTTSNQEEQLARTQKELLLAEGIEEQDIHYEVGEPNDGNQEFVKLFRSLQRGDILVVWRLDRIGGSLSGLVKLVIKMMRKGVGFKSITEQIDTLVAQEKTVIEFFELLASYEHCLASERIKIGIEKARHKGKTRGRPKAITNEMEEKIMKMIKAGNPKTSICRDLKIPRSTLYEMLKRQK